MLYAYEINFEDVGGKRKAIHVASNSMAGATATAKENFPHLHQTWASCRGELICDRKVFSGVLRFDDEVIVPPPNGPDETISSEK